MSFFSVKTGVLLVNLGSPDAANDKAVRKYLKQFLNDKRVIHEDNMPRWLWWFILNVLILPARPKKSAKLYQKVWNSFGKGSPLVAISKKQVAALENYFQNSNVEIALAMRYGNPSIAHGMNELLAKDVEKIIVLPLFPQYSKTTTESVFDEIRELKILKKLPQIQLINNYHDHPAYIDALKQSILKFWDTHGKADKLIISYHGLPQKYVDKGDIYPQQCETTTKLLVAALNLSSEQYLHCYQSRFGRQVWLQPYLDKQLKAMPAAGIKNVQVICPGFAADCLETLEEIEHENREYFMQAGGQQYNYIPALNHSPEHISSLLAIIKQSCA